MSGHREETNGPTAHPLKSRSIILRIVAALALIGVIAFAGRWFGSEIGPFEDWIRGLGLWGPIIFLALFLVVTGLQLPESIMAVAAGVAFGLPVGLAILVFSNVIGAVVWFWIARRYLRGVVQRLLSRHPKLEAVEKATAMEGFRLIVLLRLGPFSYGTLNLLLGASDVRFWPYFLALIGVIPGNFATVYFGSMARHVASKAADADDLSDGHFIIMAIGFAVTLAVVGIIARVAHDALRKYRLEVSDPPVGT